MEEINWYNDVRHYTERLVAIRSVSPSEGEIHAAEEIHSLLCLNGIGELYTECGLDAIEGDSYGRKNAYAFLKGSRPETIVLLGHFDTVGTKDYGALEHLALNTTELTAQQEHLLVGASEARDTQTPQDWLFGRGAADMKSGVAVNIALIRRLAGESSKQQLPLSVVMIATADEEYENTGAMQATRLLLRLRQRYDLNYLGVLNTDYTNALYPGDPHRYIYAGTIGKLLPSFLCIGRESHVGTPFNGLDANLLSAELIRDLSMNVDLCDVLPSQMVAPPVTLHSADLKTEYNVQLPHLAYFYLNVLTLTTTPDELLAKLRLQAEQALTRLLHRMDEAEQLWRRKSGTSGADGKQHVRTGRIYTYHELYQEMIEHYGADRVQDELAREWQESATQEKRERSLRLALRLWTLSGKQGPAVLIYYSPPFCPHVAPTPGPLYDAVKQVMEAHPQLNLKLLDYFPYLSDLSYLKLEQGIKPEALRTNTPLWLPDAQSAANYPGAYSLPLEEMQQLNLPVINWGSYGRGVHQRDEAVSMSYTFGSLPQLLYETIKRLAM